MANYKGHAPRRSDGEGADGCEAGWRPAMGMRRSQRSVMTCKLAIPWDHWNGELLDAKITTILDSYSFGTKSL